MHIHGSYNNQEPRERREKKHVKWFKENVTPHGPVPCQLKEMFYSSSRRALCPQRTHSKAGLIALAHLQTQPPASFKIRRLEDFAKMKVLGCAGSEETVREPEPGWSRTWERKDEAKLMRTQSPAPLQGETSCFSVSPPALEDSD